MEDEKTRAASLLIERTQGIELRRSKFGLRDFIGWSVMRLEMRKFFKWFGRFIGTHPAAALIAFFIMISFIFFAFPMNLRDRVRDGYTPKNSKAYHESKALRDFSGLSGDPMMTSVMLRARDKSSMIDPDNLMEAVRLLQHVKTNISVESKKKTFHRYSDFCGRHCRQNDIVDYFALEIVKFRRGEFSSMLRSKLTYPMATIMGQPVQLEMNFFGVQTAEVATRNYTNIEYCELILLTFTADISRPEEEDIVAHWERAVYDFASARSRDERVEMLVIGAEIVDLEMNKDSQRMSPYFAIGFVGAAFFIFISAWFSFFLYGRLSIEFRGKRALFFHMVLPIFVCLIPAAAIATTFGIYGIIGWRINSLMLIMPFLIMGIGVNDSFLVVHHWLRERTSLPRAELMAAVFEDVGPSITMTTLTNVISFFIGALAPTEEIALFCAGSAIAMGLAYIFTLLFFGALLSYYSPIEGCPEPKKSSKQQGAGTFFDKLLLYYSKLLQNNLFRSVFLLIWIGFIIGGIVGCTTITSKLETEKILPHESPIRTPNRIIEEQIWPVYYPAIVIVQRPFDAGDTALNEEFMQFVDEFEHIPGSRGPNSTVLWLRNYRDHFDMTAEADMSIFDSDEESATIEKGVYDNSLIQRFMRGPTTKHFAGMVVADYKLSPPIRKFSFVVAYKNHTTWDDRIRIQEEWRAICESHPNLNASVWNVNGMFVDQMQSLKRLATESIIATLLAMVVVTFIFIQKPVPVAVAVLSIGSIAAGTIGYISIWKLDLDPVTICAILISIGMSVDFTAHISMYFVNCPSRVEGLAPVALDRLIYSIGSIFWPAIQGNASTLICVLPLVALNNYIPLVFVKTLTLVVIIGTAHGLLLIPMLLSLVPSSWLEWDLLSRKKRSSSSEGGGVYSDRSAVGKEMQLLAVGNTLSAEEPLLLQTPTPVEA